MATAHLDTLAPIRDKVHAGVRLGLEDGLTLLESDDILALGELADTARVMRGGSDDVFYSDGSDEPGDPAHVRLEYGHGQTDAQIIGAMIALRERQSETGAIVSFIALTGDADATTGQDDVRMIAVSRLMLDNIADIKVDSGMLTTPLSQVVLSFGANELSGPPADEQILLIREAGKNPVKR